MSIISKLKKHWQCRTAKGYEQWLRQQGVVIGKNLMLFQHKTIRIDTSSPGLITIGDNVHITAGVSILTHDGRFWFLRNMYHDFIPSRAAVHIGNNIYIGQNAMILKGVSIGDNSIVGAGSVCTKDVPANSIVAGVPAKVIMTTDEFYRKSKENALRTAQQYARDMYAYRGALPSVSDFWEEFAFFYHVEHEAKYPKDFVRKVKTTQMFGMTFEEFIQNNTPLYESFEAFLQDALKEKVEI